MTGQVAFVTKEEIAGKQPVDEGISNSGEFALAKSEEFEALSPAGEAVLGRWELQEIGGSGEQILAWPLVGVNGGLERKDQFWGPLHFVDRE
ncbi:hypothetical protein MDOR_29700 [Mycolicibacterium doricum]|uniref:Uncharacterized protein n=1 Tax=Mycolicibacterium doricum TaxID=126673 RepID=A0A7I7VWI3_9MYCO|nr:hypothetical protein MDOR_29700 [Mycolicibacterium doricum]